MSDLGRKIVLGAVLLLGTLTLAGLYLQAAPAEEEIRYSTFLQQVQQGQVGTVTLQGEMIYGVRKDKTQFKTYNPETGYSRLLRTLLDAHVAVEGRPEDPPNPLSDLLPLLVLAALAGLGLLYGMLRIHRALWGPDAPSKGSRGARGRGAARALSLEKPAARGSGTLACITHEGGRAQLIELQVRVDPVPTGAPCRDVRGLDAGRVARMIAVLSNHSHLGLRGHDVFAGTAGGAEIRDPGTDLPLLLALASSHRGRALPAHLLAFGEIDLSGEVRPVAFGEARLRMAQSQGFEVAIVPQGNAPHRDLQGLAVIPVANVDEALAAAFAQRRQGTGMAA